VAHRRVVRLVVIPLCLFVGVSATVFALAKLALAEPGTPGTAAGGVELGDAYRGRVVYSQSCAGCHGATGEGGIGPSLAGSRISLVAAQAQIENGGGTMPARLVTGRQQADVLAYLATIFASEEN
jgi:mono/diheme cytochrome c family protein